MENRISRGLVICLATAAMVGSCAWVNLLQYIQQLYDTSPDSNGVSIPLIQPYAQGMQINSSMVPAYDITVLCPDGSYFGFLMPADRGLREPIDNPNAFADSILEQLTGGPTTNAARLYVEQVGSGCNSIKGG